LVDCLASQSSCVSTVFSYYPQVASTQMPK
jgi:hypothetical protein